MANQRDRTIAYFRHICTLAVATAAFTLTLVTASPNKSFVREDLLQMGMMTVIAAALAGFVVQTLCVFCYGNFGQFRMGCLGTIFGAVSVYGLIFGLWHLMQFVLLNLPVQTQQIVPADTLRNVPAETSPSQ